jgi:hypothetical protein
MKYTMDDIKRALEIAKHGNNLCYEGEKASAILAIYVDALEKQMPEKPRTRRGAGRYSDLTYYHCPKCGCIVAAVADWEKESNFAESLEEVGHKYCHDCGQAIEWSDEP